MLAIVAALIIGASPCPSPSPSQGAISSPCPSPTPLKTIASLKVGRGADLVGQVDAASTGTISQAQIDTRPILRPGEVLEAVPGLVISQHSGEGKANQYYLRGFQLDHGTDLESTIEGVPINLPTHAHGQGYSDINWLMPELVDFVEYKKGPYYADQGDFSTAGSYNLYFRDSIPETVSVGSGSYGYDRLFLADSHAAGSGTLLYAAELLHDNNSFAMPDEYKKLNAVVRWSKVTKDSDFGITAMGYGGVFDSTDQIPQRLVNEGVIGRYGYVDPSDGGQTSRYAISSQYNHDESNGQFSANVFGFEQYLNLYSDFLYDLGDATDYYNVTANPITCNVDYTTCSPGSKRAPDYTSYCPANDTAIPAGAAARSVTPTPFSYSCGDQREQQDQRFVSGFNLSRTFDTPGSTTKIGLGLRNDNIATVGLYLTNDRVRYPDGALSDDHVVERDVNAYLESTIKLNRKLRIIPGVRADLYDFSVVAPLAANSGAFTQGIVSPKFSSAYTLDPHDELYLDAGDSFHSNDARGVTQTLDPQTHATFDSTGAPVTQVSPLVRAVGEEIGYRHSTNKLTSTVSVWQLNIASELTFNGDDGTTSPAGPTTRHGLELANFYKPTPWLTVDGDYATSAAQFTTNVQNMGTYVPESLNEVIAGGVTIDKPGYSTSLRVRYFGPRTLNQDGTAVSAASTILNYQYTAKLHTGAKVTLAILNLLNAQSDDVEYYYQSWLPQDAKNSAYANNPAINPLLGGQGVNDYTFHPSELRSIRVTVSF